MSSRVSSRSRVQPQRFRPGASADMPDDLAKVIHEAATSAAAGSSIPFEASAVVALEEALEPMLEALCAAALEKAQAAGRDEITEADLKAAAKPFMK